MTREKSFKRLVRARMAKTGESYTAARAVLLAGPRSAGDVDAGRAATAAATSAPVMATSDAEIRRRTGRGWEQWFDLLDEWGAGELTHRETARKVAAELGIQPLVWEAQAVTVSYERARGLRVVGQRADGFAATASRTIAVPVEAVFDAVADARRRRRWLPDGRLTERSTARPRSVRFDWADGSTRVNIVFDPKGPEKTTVTVEHSRLADATEAERLKAYWRDGLTSLKTQVEAATGGR